MDPTPIVKSLTAVANIAKRLVNTVKEVEAKKVAIELQSVILSLQDQILSMQHEHSNLLQIKNDLEKELMNLKDWEKTKSQYELKEVVPGFFVYSPKPNSKFSEPDHWLCANCFNDGKKSILQRKRSKYLCPKCETEVFIPSGKKLPLRSIDPY